MNTVFGFSRLQSALVVAIVIALAIALMPQPAHSQVIAVPTFKAPSVCSGQSMVNTIDAVFCVFEGTGINMDSVVVYSAVGPINEGLETSWVKTQVATTTLCVPTAFKDVTLKAAKLMPSNMAVKLIEEPAIPGRTCWSVK